MLKGLNGTIKRSRELTEELMRRGERTGAQAPFERSVKRTSSEKPKDSTTSLLDKGKDEHFFIFGNAD